MERHGLATASLSALPEITAKVRPPRALAVPYALGFTLGAANDPPMQRDLMRQALALLSEPTVPILRHARSPSARQSGDQGGPAAAPEPA